MFPKYYYLKNDTSIIIISEYYYLKNYITYMYEYTIFYLHTHIHPYKVTNKLLTTTIRHRRILEDVNVSISIFVKAFDRYLSTEASFSWSISLFIGRNLSVWLIHKLYYDFLRQKYIQVQHFIVRLRLYHNYPFYILFVISL